MKHMPTNPYHARAMSAYWRSEGENASIPRGNTDLLCDDEGKQYVVLSNGAGVLAVYRVRNDDVLKRLKRWPSRINNLY
jgi:hypothetical protein